MLERKQFQSTRFAVASHHHSRRELLACDMGQRALCTRVNHSEFQYVRGNPLYGCKHERVALCFLVFPRGIEPLPERTGFWFEIQLARADTRQSINVLRDSYKVRHLRQRYRGLSLAREKQDAISEAALKITRRKILPEPIRRCSRKQARSGLLKLDRLFAKFHLIASRAVKTLGQEWLQSRAVPAGRPKDLRKLFRVEQHTLAGFCVGKLIGQPFAGAAALNDFAGATQFCSPSRRCRFSISGWAEANKVGVRKKLHPIWEPNAPAERDCTSRPKPREVEYIACLGSSLHRRAVVRKDAAPRHLRKSGKSIYNFCYVLLVCRPRLGFQWPVAARVKDHLRAG